MSTEVKPVIGSELGISGFLRQSVQTCQAVRRAYGNATKVLGAIVKPPSPGGKAGLERGGQCEPGWDWVGSVLFCFPWPY